MTLLPKKRVCFPRPSRQYGNQASDTRDTEISVFFGATSHFSSSSDTGSTPAWTSDVSSSIWAFSSSSCFCSDWAFSSARATSCASFSVRPAPRAVVAARPSADWLNFLRPVKAVRMAAPNEMAVWIFCCPASVFSRSTVCPARRIRSSRAAILGAYFCRRRSTCRSRFSLPACCRRMRKSRSGSPGPDRSPVPGLFRSASFRFR